MKKNARSALFACFAVCLALLASCGSSDDPLGPEPPPACDRIGDPTYTGPGYGVIGPAGGVVEETDPKSPIAGVRVEVAPGAWKECWQVRLGYASLFETRDYPDGFEPFQRPGPSGSVEITVGLQTRTRFENARGPLPMEISFPLRNIHPGPLDIKSAYFYDTQQETWRIVLPGKLTRDRLTIATSAHDAKWSWGRVDLLAVDYDTHLKPALVGYYGAETLTGIEAALEEIRRDAAKETWAVSCAGLGIARAFFIRYRDIAATQIEEIGASLDCGTCNPLSEKFQEELEEWWEVERWNVMLDFAGVATMRKAADVVKVAMTAISKSQEGVLECVFDPVGCAIDQAKPDTACNYDCYFKKVPSLAMNLNKGVYYACDWIQWIIERYRTQILKCP